MIKSEMGTVSMRGTVPVIISELAHAMKGIRESLLHIFRFLCYIYQL